LRGGNGKVAGFFPAGEAFLEARIKAVDDGDVGPAIDLRQVWRSLLKSDTFFSSVVVAHRASGKKLESVESRKVVP